MWEDMAQALICLKYDKTLLELLQIAEKDGQITEQGRELKNEIVKLMAVEKDHYGLLSALGEEELEGIGARLGQNFKDIFSPDKKIIAQSYLQGSDASE